MKKSAFKKNSTLKKITAVCLCGAMAAGMVALTGCGSSSTSNNTSSAPNSSTAPTPQMKSGEPAASSEKSYTGIHHATLEVEGYDPITIELDADSAPITVTNFIDLINKGYYDGLTFYRIQDGFVIQGGTKGNNAAGNDSSLTPIVGEFSTNGQSNALADKFGYGTIAMARTNNPDSATSTFFITLGDNQAVGPALDGKYAAFGTIDADGMKVVEQIISDNIANVNPSDAMGIITDESGQPVIKSITLVD